MDSRNEQTEKDSAHYPGHMAALHDVDVAAGLDSDQPLDPEAAALLR